jgi:hypothetical protein
MLDFVLNIIFSMNMNPYPDQCFDSVLDTDPDSEVFVPRGSRSVSRMYGSGSFHHQVKLVRKTYIFTVL